MNLFNSSSSSDSSSDSSPLSECRTKGPWTADEDKILTRLVDRYGPRNWSLICKHIKGRSGKSCRLRWWNQLSPAVEHRPFSAEEDAAILAAHQRYGNRWATIARLLPGRTDNAVKNHWNSSLKRRCCLKKERTGDLKEWRFEDVDDPMTVLSLAPPGMGRSETPENFPAGRFWDERSD